MTFRKLFLVLILLSSICSIAFSATFIGTSPDWFETSNWSTGIVPGIDDGHFNDFSLNAMCIISGAGSDAEWYKLQLPSNNTMMVEDGASVTASLYMDIGYLDNNSESVLEVTNATFSARKMNVAVNGSNATGSAIFTNSTYYPYNDGTEDTLITVCRDNGVSEGEVTFTNSTLSRFHHDGTANNLYLILTVDAQDAEATLNIENSDIHIGWYAIAGQAGHGIINMDGGNLTTGTFMNIGNQNNSVSSYNGWGQLTMTSGTITTGSNFNVRTGSDSHYSTVDMTGGAIYATGYFALMRNAVVNISGTSQIEAGTFRMDNVASGGAEAVCHLSGSAVLICDNIELTGGVVDLSDSAQIVIRGDVCDIVNYFVDLGFITGDGIYRKVDVSYNSVADQTIMTAGSSDMLNKAYRSTLIGDIFRNDNNFKWSAGNGAVSHTLYLSTDRDEVANASISPVYSGANATYNYGSVFDPGVYYWRVDEYDGSMTWEGDVWSFTAAGFEIDDFEYADTAALRAVWTENAGASVRIDPNTWVEPNSPSEIIFVYDNTSAPYYSEITRVSTAIDFTANDLKSMDISFMGSESNSNEPVFVTLSDGVNSATILSASASQQSTWHIDYAEFVQANSNLDLTNIRSVSLGVGDKTNPQSGGSGTMQFGLIALYEKRCWGNPAADMTGDCIVDFYDIAVFSQQWLSDSLWPNE